MGALGTTLRAAAPAADCAARRGGALRENITLDFGDTHRADEALTALGLRPAGLSIVDISNAGPLKQIIATMVRAANGLDLTFKAHGRDFTARVRSGLGGAGEAERAQRLGAAATLRDRLIATLKRIIVVTGGLILRWRKTTTGGTP